MNTHLFSRLWKAASFTIFFIAVFFVLLFVQGYEYDPFARDLVKKSVIFFEEVLAGETTALQLDGKPAEFSAPGELRLLPGTHHIELQSPGYSPFRKTVELPVDTVIRFPELRLTPLSPETPLVASLPLQDIESLALQPFSSEGVLATDEFRHYALYYPAQDPSAFTITEMPVSFSRFHKIMPSPFRTKGQYLGIGNTGELLSLDVESGEVITVAPGPFLDIRESNDRVFLLAEGGSLWELRDDLAAPVLFFNSLFSAQEIAETRRSGDDVRWFLLREKNGIQSLVVTDESGAILFQERDVDSAWAQASDVYFSRDMALMHFSLSKKVLEEHTLSVPMLWMSNIGDTYHMLGITNHMDLLFCDRDAENCHSLGVVDAPWMVASEDRFRFLSVQNGQLTWWNAASPANSGLPPFLRDLVFPRD